MIEIYYQGSDGCIKTLGDNELQHFKYIKKIGNRYFYTPEELRSYYNASKAVSNTQYNMSNHLEDRRFNKTREISKKNRTNDKNMAKKATYIHEDSNGNTKVLQGKERKKAVKKYQSDIDKKYNKADQKEVNRHLRKKRSNNVKRKIDPILNTSKAAINGDITKKNKGKQAANKQMVPLKNYKKVKKDKNYKPPESAYIAVSNKKRPRARKTTNNY